MQGTSELQMMTNHVLNNTGGTINDINLLNNPLLNSGHNQMFSGVGSNRKVASSRKSVRSMREEYEASLMSHSTQ